MENLKDYIDERFCISPYTYTLIEIAEPSTTTDYYELIFERNIPPMSFDSCNSEVPESYEPSEYDQLYIMVKNGEFIYGVCKNASEKIWFNYKENSTIPKNYAVNEYNYYYEMPPEPEYNYDITHDDYYYEPSEIDFTNYLIDNMHEIISKT